MSATIPELERLIAKAIEGTDYRIWVHPEDGRGIFPVYASDGTRTTHRAVMLVRIGCEVNPNQYVLPVEFSALLERER